LTDAMRLHCLDNCIQLNWLQFPQLTAADSQSARDLWRSKSTKGSCWEVHKACCKRKVKKFIFFIILHIL